MQLEEELVPLESRRALESGLRQPRLVEGRPRRSLSEPWLARRSSGPCGVVVALEYDVRRANRRVHAAFTVDGINEADLFVRISCRVPVGKSSMWANRKYPTEETDAKARRDSRGGGSSRSTSSRGQKSRRVGEEGPKRFAASDGDMDDKMDTEVEKLKTPKQLVPRLIDVSSGSRL